MGMERILNSVTVNRRGRRRRDEGPVLDRERLTATLLEIALTHGVPGLQMRPVAKALGVSPKVLYNHVTDKQGMLDILVETILEKSLPDVTALTWDEALRAMANALHKAYKPYPGVLEMVLAQGSAALQRDYTIWFHAAARSALTEAGLAEEDIYPVFARFAVLVMGSVLYAESNARSLSPAETEEMLDRCFEQNLEMFLRDVRRISAETAAA